MAASKDSATMTGTDWTPALIRMLRGKRTQSEFGGLIGVPKNTVWRWETGHVRPDPENANKLGELARREGFLQSWQLAGSITLVGDLETASKKIGDAFQKSLSRSAKRLRR